MRKFLVNRLVSTAHRQTSKASKDLQEVLTSAARRAGATRRHSLQEAGVKRPRKDSSAPRSGNPVRLTPASCNEWCRSQPRRLAGHHWRFPEAFEA